MSAVNIFQYTLIASFSLAIVAFIVLLFVDAPYGRHIRKGWGPLVSNRLAWFMMEAPSPLLILTFFLLGTAPKNIVLIIFLLMWQAHYLHRAFIYPFYLSGKRRPLPISVISMGVVFNAGNAFLNGSYLFTFSGGYARAWLGEKVLLVGVSLFVFGFIINRWADRELYQLQLSSSQAYVIPQAGLYRWVSCPNYLGEIIIWIGWAIATWSLPGLIFALWTIANLMPRARTHHRWYRKTFTDYPHERKALIPGIW